MSLINPKPNFVDLVYGIDGKWADSIETTEEGVVIPRYYPTNAMGWNLIKPVEYPARVPKEAITGPVQPSSKQAPGRANQAVVITQTVDGDSTFLDKIDQDIESNIDDLRRRLKHEKRKASYSDQKREQAVDDEQQRKKELQNRSGGQRRRSDTPDDKWNR